MATEYVKYRTQAAQAELPMSTDDLRTLFNALVDALNAVGAKLDADSGVADTTYLATIQALIQK